MSKHLCTLALLWREDPTQVLSQTAGPFIITCPPACLPLTAEVAGARLFERRLRASTSPSAASTAAAPSPPLMAATASPPRLPSPVTSSSTPSNLLGGGDVSELAAGDGGGVGSGDRVGDDGGDGSEGGGGGSGFVSSIVTVAIEAI